MERDVVELSRLQVAMTSMYHFIFGALLAVAGLIAFFLEATFVGPFFFGQPLQRRRPADHAVGLHAQVHPQRPVLRMFPKPKAGKHGVNVFCAHMAASALLPQPLNTHRSTVYPDSLLACRRSR